MCSASNGSRFVRQANVMTASSSGNAGGLSAEEADARLQIGNDLEVGYGGFYRCTQ